jgi:hypothetical protein
MTIKTVSIVSNATVAKVVQGDREVKLLVSKLLRYSVAGAEHTSLGKLQGWDGKKSFFTFKKSTFPAGFARSIVGKLSKKGYKVNWVKKELPDPLGPVRPVIDELGYTEKYSYQPDTVDRLVKFGQIIAKVATGGGKSRIARIAHKRVGRKTLFLTTRGSLMYQMKYDYEANIK